MGGFVERMYDFVMKSLTISTSVSGKVEPKFLESLNNIHYFTPARVSTLF